MSAVEQAISIAGSFVGSWVIPRVRAAGAFGCFPLNSSSFVLDSLVQSLLFFIIIFFFLAFLFVEILHCYHLEIIGLSLLSLLAAAG